MSIDALRMRNVIQLFGILGMYDFQALISALLMMLQHSIWLLWYLRPCKSTKRDLL